MISILPSEGLAPAQAAPKQNKLSDTSSKPDESPFSSLVSRDSADGDANPNAESSAPGATAAGSNEPGSDTVRPKAAPSSAATEQIDSSIVESLEIGATSIEAEAPRTRTETDSKSAISMEHRAPHMGRATDVSSDAMLASDVDAAAPDKRAAPPILAGTASAEQTLAADAELKSTDKVGRTPQAVDAETIAAETKLARNPTSPAAQSLAPVAQADPAQDTLRIVRQQDGADLSRAELKSAQLASDADLAGSTNKALLTGIVADAKAATAMTSLPETLLSIAQPSSVSAPALTAGLTPVAPSIPLAAPSEINSIILNALKNGAEPQEQLIVQLDPPELGRVAIDFKFDAQGLQQITVTSENPEALRRLRELHFELTEALREHGLSEQNLSFRQQADDQSQPAWQQPELSGSGDLFAFRDDTQTQTTISRSNTAYTHPDRLDLTL